MISFLVLSDKHLLLIDGITSGLQFSGIINDDTVAGELSTSDDMQSCRVIINGIITAGG